MKKTIITSLTQKPYLFQKAGKRLLILGIALMITAGSFAQESDEESSDATSQSSNDSSNGDPDVPFDGGISLLVAAGVAYGAKKAHEAKQKQAANFDGIQQ